MLHIKKLMGMHNKGTYMRVFTYAYTRIDIRVYAYRHTRIRKIRAYNTRMRSSYISELHCNFQTCLHDNLVREDQKAGNGISELRDFKISEEHAPRPLKAPSSYSRLFASNQLSTTNFIKTPG